MSHSRRTKKDDIQYKNGKTEYLTVKNKKSEVTPIVTSEVKNGMIKQVPQHKSLGTWFEESEGYTVNIEKNLQKLPFMILTTKVQASPSNLGTLAVQGRLKLLEAVVIPSLLYNTEAFQSIPEKDIQQLEKMQLKMLTEVLEVTRSTPYYPLLMETGFWTMRARISYRRLMLYHNIVVSDERRITKQLIEEQKRQMRNTTWYSEIQREIEKYKITLEPQNSLKSEWKKHVKDKITAETTSELKTKCSEMTKGRWITSKELVLSEYLKKLSLKESKKILRVRMNMVKIPGNYKGNSVEFCPLCKLEERNAEHYFHCSQVKQIKESCGVVESDLKSSNIKVMQNVALFFENVEIMVEPVMKKI